MLMTTEVRDRLNYLLGKTFEMNSIADNIAYNLDYYDYPRAGAIYHENYAHVYPGWADTISGLMIKLNARPVRHAMPEYSEDFGGDIVKMFDATLEAAEKYRQDIIETIELAELNNDYEVKIQLEEFLVNFVPYRKQAQLWATEAKRYAENTKSFDARFDKFTTFISISTTEEDDDDDDD